MFENKETSTKIYTPFLNSLENMTILGKFVSIGLNSILNWFQFPFLSGDVPRLPSYDIYISQLVRFARCCTSVFDFHSKILKSLQNY